jgi:hypothetical protein
MDIDQELAAAQARLTELTQQFVDAIDNPDRRREIANKLKTARDQVTRLYELLPA